MNTIRPGDLAVVVAGLWPNVGRIVYVSDAVFDTDFSAMGLDTKLGWRVRSYSDSPLQRTDGFGMSGVTPFGSLRALERLSKALQIELDVKMALADLAEALTKQEDALECQKAEVFHHD